MSEKKSNQGLKRRKFLKTLVALPVLGGLTYLGYKEFKYFDGKIKRKKALELLGLKNNETLQQPISNSNSNSSEKHIRLGIIGIGFRGNQLLQACGFASREWVKSNSDNFRIKAFKNQFDLNITITGICDVFDLHAEQGVEITENPLFDSGKLASAKRFKTYKELIDSKDIDAVMISTPDHWHAPITIYAASAGKHVYCEKCMTRTEDEAYEVYNTIKKSDVVFQVGHQNRHHKSIIKAGQIYEQGILGNISTIETFTNRNTPRESWIRHVGKPGDKTSIDWNLFQGNNNVPFDIKRFYNWTHYWDYGTGMAGQLLSHEFDIINQITGIGIPETVVATGGIYHYNDGREIPDVFNAVFNYPKQGLTMTYNATLANSSLRNAKILGSDAEMELGQDPKVKLDAFTIKYKELIDDELIDPVSDVIMFNPATDDVDAITSATQKHYASKGLTYTEHEGKMLDATHLHIQDWLNHIRDGGQPSCNIERGFEEAITCHMATKAYKEQRLVRWDPVTRKIV